MGARRGWVTGALAGIVALGLALAVIFYAGKSDFVKSRAQNTFDTSNMRIGLWKGALQQWQLEPIIGTGSGTYRYFGRFFREASMQQDPLYAHNDYIHLLAEYGLVGVVGMALFPGVHLWHGTRNFRRLGPLRVGVSQQVLGNSLALNIGALAAVASFLAHSVVDFNLHIPGNLLVMAFVFGLLANDGALREPERPGQEPNDWWWRLLLPGLGVVLLVFSVQLFPGEYFSERARVAVRDERGGLGLMNALHGLRTDPENPDLHYYLGQARMILGRSMDEPEAAASFYESGIASLAAARSIAPRDEVYALGLAAALDRAGRFEEAEWIYYETFPLDPKSRAIRRAYDFHLAQWQNSGTGPG